MRGTASRFCSGESGFIPQLVAARAPAVRSLAGNLRTVIGPPTCPEV